MKRVVTTDTIRCKRHSIRAQKDRIAGFTLIEMIITVSIAVILSSLAAPSLREWVVDGQTRELSSEFHMALTLAQSEAIKRGLQVSIAPQALAGNAWLNGWTVFEDRNSNGIQDAGELTLLTHEWPDNGLTLVSSDSVFSNWLAFLPSGAVTGNAGINGGFRLCRKDRNTQKSRTITLQSSGNIIVEKGTVSCP